MEKANKDIRDSIKKLRIRYWQVADALGKTSWTFSVWLRKPLDEEKRNLVIKAIEKVKEELADESKK
jgi:hypothetical protein